MKILKRAMGILLLTSAFLLTLTAQGQTSPYDFKEGDIYYRILDAANKKVTFAGITYGYGELTDAPGVKGARTQGYYNIGTLTVPKTVTHGGITYSVDAYSPNNGVLNMNGKGEYGLTKFVLEAEWTYIPHYMLYGNVDLEEIVLPTTVKDIGYCAFGDNKKLKKITGLDNVESMDASGSIFGGCSVLEELYMPKLKKISEYYNHFKEMPCLKKITVGKLVYVRMFSGASNLEEIIVVDDDKYQSIDGVVYSKDGKTLVLVPPGKCSSGTFSIPSTVTTIGESAFEGISQLTSITIPNSCTKIGTRAFRNCVNLTDVTIPNSVTTIGTYAFEGCSSLKSVTIPGSVEGISLGAFNNCSSLETVTISDGVKTIGHSSFAGCTTLKTVTISNSVTTVNNNAFLNCSSLTGFHIPQGVTAFAGGALNGCSNLETITVDDDNSEYCVMYQDR